MVLYEEKYEFLYTNYSLKIPVFKVVTLVSCQPHALQQRDLGSIFVSFHGGYVVVKVTLAQITLQIFWLSFLVLFYLLFVPTFIFKATCSFLFTDGSQGTVSWITDRLYRRKCRCIFSFKKRASCTKKCDEYLSSTTTFLTNLRRCVKCYKIKLVQFVENIINCKQTT